MKIRTERIERRTKGAGDFIDLTEDLHALLKETRFIEGALTVFVVGSTAAITSFEFEGGLVKDLREFYEKLVPSDRTYHHDATWNDDNGFSHVRAAIQGPTLTIPFQEGKLLLGTWQQIVLAEFDHRPRERTVIAQFIGV